MVKKSRIFIEASLSRLKEPLSIRRDDGRFCSELSWEARVLRTALMVMTPGLVMLPPGPIPPRFPPGGSPPICWEGASGEHCEKMLIAEMRAMH